MTEPHAVDIIRAPGLYAAWVAVCTTDDCGWCPDVIHPTAHAAFIAAGRLSIDTKEEA